MAKDSRRALPQAIREQVRAFEDALLDLADGETDSTEGVAAAAGEAVNVARRLAARKGRADDLLALVEIEDVLARNVRACRVQSGWSQANLADAMTRLGFPWKRITVVEVEGGSRRLAWKELLGLVILFGIPLVELLRLQPAEELMLGRQPGSMAPMSADDVAALVTGEGWQPGRGDEWFLPRQVAVGGPHADDWRPAAPMWAVRRRADLSLEEAIERTTRRD